VLKGQAADAAKEASAARKKHAAAVGRLAEAEQKVPAVIAQNNTTQPLPAWTFSYAEVKK